MRSAPKFLAIAIVAIVASISSTPFSIVEPGKYGPAFEETGFHGAGDYYAMGPEVIVNHFGGNLMVTANDVDVPSVGDFKLAFVRVHNSGGEINRVNQITALRKTDGPLGVGWTANYGFLRYSGAQPEFVNGSGGRELFYRHTAAELSAVRPPIPDQDLWVSQGLRVLVRESTSKFVLYDPSGLRYTLEFAVTGKFVPTLIEDKAGNRWTVTYVNDWYIDYPDHPIVDEVRDEENRALDFRYTALGNKRRLQYIYLNSTRMSEYVYQLYDDLYYLRQHITPEGRTTTYDYFATGFKQGAMYRITLPTGGVWEFDYSQHRFYFPGTQGNSEVLAVDSMKKDSDTWFYTYPAEASSGNEFTVIVNGPEGFVGSYTYYTYQNGTCTNTDLWRVGQLASSTETYNGTQKTTSTFYASPLKISEQAVWSDCSSWQTPYTLRVDHETETQDGIPLTRTYSNYDLIFPRTVTGAGGIVESTTYEHRVGASIYLLGLVRQTTKQVNENLVGKTEFSDYRNDGLPRSVKTYRTPSQSIDMTLDYWDSPGKRGALLRKSYGGYCEEYDYRYGVLQKITRPGGGSMGPSVTLERPTIAVTGRVEGEKIDGVERTIGYDGDGRLKSITFPVDATLLVAYNDATNTATVTHGTDQEEYVYDRWGRLKSYTTAIDNTAATTSYQYNGLGYQKVETGPKVTYAMTYDVHGRMRTRQSPEDSYVIVYKTSATGVTQTTTKNSLLMTVKKEDFLGRILEGSINGYAVNYTYQTNVDGIEQTIQGNGTRTVTYDFFGNKVQETHPEFNSTPIVYDYDGRGWLWQIRKPEGDETREYYDNGRLKHVSRAGYSATLDFVYHPIYGTLTSATYNGVSRNFSDFDSQGRPRQLQVAIPQPMTLNIPGTSVRVEPTTTEQWLVSECDVNTSATQILKELLSQTDPLYTTCYRKSTIAIDDDVVLTWTAVPGATGYDVEISMDGDIRGSLQRSSAGEVRASEFGLGWNYSAALTALRVRARNGAYTGPWSLWRSNGGSIPGCSSTFGGVNDVFTVGISYEPLGRIQKYTHPSTGQPAQEYTYATGAGVKSVSYGATPVIQSGQYGVLGSLESFNYQPHGAFLGGNVSRTYDNLGRLTSINSQVLGAGGVGRYQLDIDEYYADWDFIRHTTRNDDLVNATFLYTYGGHGELDLLTVANEGTTDTVDYNYDPRGNLLGYDGLSAGLLNIPAVNASYDTNNHITSFDYDEAGRLRQTASHQFVSNSLDQIAEVRDLTGSDVLVSYGYDDNGERVLTHNERQVVYSIRNLSGDVLTQVEYALDANGCWGLAEERDYIYFDGAPISTVAKQASHQTWQFHVRDNTGSLAVVFDESNGYGPEYRAYSPYGDPMLESSAIQVTHEFAGYERDQITGFDYVHARYYDRVYGRFNRPDPGFNFVSNNSYTLNLYNYAQDNPANFTDPTGEQPRPGQRLGPNVGPPPRRVLPPELQRWQVELFMNARRTPGASSGPETPMESVREGLGTLQEYIKNFGGITASELDRAWIIAFSKWIKSKDISSDPWVVYKFTWNDLGLFHIESVFVYDQKPDNILGEFDLYHVYLVSPLFPPVEPLVPGFELPVMPGLKLPLEKNR
jgi:RHS repeat-associated protein